MLLTINKKIYIETDALNYNVMEKTKIKTGEKAGQDGTPKVLGHFPSPDGALKFLLRRTVKMSKSQDNMQQVIDELRRIEDEIDKALAPLHLK